MYLICQGALSLSSNYNPEHVNISRKKDKFLTEHLICSVRPDFVLSNTPNSQSKTHLRTPFLQNSSQWLLSQMTGTFLERPNQKQCFTPPVRLILLKSCNCIKIKIFFIYNSEKTNEIYLSNFLLYMKYEKPLHVWFIHIMFTFVFKFLKTSLIIKELIKHENKFNSSLSRQGKF